MFDPSPMADAVLATFGEAAMLHAADTDFPIEGMWRGPYDEFQIGGVAMKLPDPTLTVRTADYRASGARDGDTIEADPTALATASPAFATNLWTIVAARPDDLGLTRLVLRAYA